MPYLCMLKNKHLSLTVSNRKISGKQNFQRITKVRPNFAFWFVHVLSPQRFVPNYDSRSCGQKFSVSPLSCRLRLRPPAWTACLGSTSWLRRSTRPCSPGPSAPGIKEYIVYTVQLQFDCTGQHRNICLPDAALFDSPPQRMWIITRGPA